MMTAATARRVVWTLSWAKGRASANLNTPARELYGRGRLSRDESGVFFCDAGFVSGAFQHSMCCLGANEAFGKSSRECCTEGQRGFGLLVFSARSGSSQLTALEIR